MKFLFLFFLFPLQLLAQPGTKDITGVWTGSLYNDTTKQFIHYELAISEYKGKLSGYSHTTFIIDSIKNIGVKAVKIKNQKGLITVEDEKLIDNNYTAPPAKGVRTFISFILSENDSTEILSGSWHTNSTREYNSLTGTVFLEKKKKIHETAIVPKLERMGLSDRLSFLTASENQKESVAVNNKMLKDEKKGTPIPAEITALNKNATTTIIPDTTIINPEIVVLVFKDKNKEAVQSNNVAKSLTGKENLPDKKDNDKAKITAIVSDKKTIHQDANSTVINVPGRSQKIIAAEKSGLIANDNNIENKKIVADKGDTQVTGIQKESNMDAADKEEKTVKKGVSKESSFSEMNKKTANTMTDVRKEEIKSNLPHKENEQKINAIAENNPKQASKKGNDEEIIRSEPAIKEVQKDLNKSFKQVAIEPSKLPLEDKKALDKKVALKEEIKTNIFNAKVLEEKKQSLPEEAVEEKMNTLINNSSKKIMPIAAAEISKREIETIRTVEIIQDSLVFSLYDNGTVDGDTVSVLLNGHVIMPRVGLLERAYNKTIYLTPEMGDSINIIMYAENLGSIAPNTGLLVIRDGGIDYEIRFSGDLKKNSAIILKRKKK
ncbi:MAG: hypothetical protein ABIR03_09155 [Ginsengibacter sp.]